MSSKTVAWIRQTLCIGAAAFEGGVMVDYVLHPVRERIPVPPGSY